MLHSQYFSIDLSIVIFGLVAGRKVINDQEELIIISYFRASFGNHKQMNYTASTVLENKTSPETTPKNGSFTARVGFYSWYGCSVVLSVVATVVLLLLLVSSVQHQSLRSGSRVLLIHLMIIQLVICGIFCPIQTHLTFQSIGQATPDFKCHPFLWLYMVTIFAENWAQVRYSIYLYLYSGYNFGWHYSRTPGTPVLL